MNNWLKRIGLSSLFGDSDTNTASGKPSYKTVQAAIESVVDGTEPKIRYVSNYKKLLEKSVIRALRYIDKLVDSIPRSIEVNHKNFAIDSQVHAYFASTSHIEEVFSNSSELKSYFKDLGNIEHDHAYALLCMTRDEKTVLGMELQNDMLRRDVMQTAVNFSDHKVMSPAATEVEVRDGIKKCIFDGLVTNALQKLLDIKSQHRGLQEQQYVLQSRLRSRQAQGGGLSTLLSSTHCVGSECEEILKQIAEAEEKLKDMPAQWELPRYYIDLVKHILGHPEDFIRLEQMSLNINKMGIKISDNSTHDASLIHLNELNIAKVLTRVVAIVRFPRKEILAEEYLYKTL